MSFRRCGRDGDGGGQDFTPLGRPGKLKTWKPDTVHGVADRQDSRFSGFQVLTQPSQSRNSAD